MALLKSVQEIFNAHLDPQTTLRISAIAGFDYLNITTSAQTTVKSSAGTLHGVMINSVPTSAIRLYDNTVSGGTQIATIPASIAAGTFYRYDIRFGTGLTISSGSTDTNITISYL